MDEYETRTFFENKKTVSGIVLISFDRIIKLEMKDGVGVKFGDELRMLMKLRELVDSALLDINPYIR